MSNIGGSIIPGGTATDKRLIESDPGHSGRQGQRGGSSPGAGGGSADVDKLHHTLVHTATEHDRKESTKKYHNPYALPHYFQAIKSAEEEVKGGKPLRKAL